MLSEDTIKKHMATFLSVGVERLSNDTVLTELVIESFFLIEMLLALQEDFNIVLVQDDIGDVTTVGELVAVLIKKGNYSAQQKAAL